MYESPVEDSVDENNENDYMLNLRDDLKNNGEKKKKRKDQGDGKQKNKTTLTVESKKTEMTQK
jgi:hypothetical protein